MNDLACSNGWCWPPLSNRIVIGVFSRRSLVRRISIWLVGAQNSPVEQAARTEPQGDVIRPVVVSGIAGYNHSLPPAIPAPQAPVHRPLPRTCLRGSTH